MTASAIDWEDFLQANQAWLRTVIAARGARSADEVDEIFQNVALADTLREDNFGAETSSEPEPLEWLLSRERQIRVREALDRLPPEAREVLLLKYFHQWNYKEIAEKLGATVSAVQAKLHRARAALKKEIRL